MLGQKEKQFKAQAALSLEQLVPQDNFYRQLEAKLDLSFVYQLVKRCYATTLGRPSIDPVVFFKLQLIMFFEGIRSERQLMEMVKLNLAYRWYIGCDLDEPVPDHSSLSKIRARYGLEVFQRFFEQIVECCIAAGLVWGKELYFDGTQVRANATLAGMVPRWYWQAKPHVHELFTPASPLPAQPLAGHAAAEPAPITTTLAILPARVDSPGTQPTAQPQPTPTLESASHPLWLVEKYDGTRLNDQRTASFQRMTDAKVSPTDPAAAPMSRFPGDPTKLGYHTHYVVDGGKSRIILAALVTPASVMDNTPMLDLERWVRFRWHVSPSWPWATRSMARYRTWWAWNKMGSRPICPPPITASATRSTPLSAFNTMPHATCIPVPKAKNYRCMHVASASSSLSTVPLLPSVTNVLLSVSAPRARVAVTFFAPSSKRCWSG